MFFPVNKNITNISNIPIIIIQVFPKIPGFFTSIVDKKPVPISDRTTHNNQNLMNKSIGLKDEVAQKVAKYGYTVEELAADYLKRQLYNIEVMKEWADNYEYTGAVMDKVSLF